MNIKFYIRSSQETARIRCQLTDGRLVKCYAKTDITIKTAWWDEKNKNYFSNKTPSDKRGSLVLQLAQLYERIFEAYSNNNEKNVDSEWLQSVVIPKSQPTNKSTFIDYFDECVATDRKMGEGRRKGFGTLRGILVRFETIILKKPLPIEWTAKTLAALEEFIMTEHLAYPNHKKLYKEMGWLVGKPIAPRCQNYCNSCIGRLRKVIRWMRINGYCKMDPFDIASPGRFIIKNDLYADAVALNAQELDLIYNAKIPEDLPASLEKTRDMFCLHCYTGARVGQFIQLKRSNVVDGVLQYIAEKTMDYTQETIRVPLCANAIAIIEKWNESDRLFPFINIAGASGYNKSIKSILRILGIKRQVITIDGNGRQKMIPICDFATSHTARKTFISIMLNNEVPREIITKMSGHSPNSRAFERYTDTTIDTLKRVISKTF